MAWCEPRVLLILIVYTILTISTQQTRALVCYTCDSLVDRYCDDKFNPDSVPNNATAKCGPDEVCVKLIFKIGSFPKPLVRRECNTPSSSDFHTITSLGQFNQCKKDRCNGSAGYGPIAVLMTISAMTIILL